MFFLKYVLSKFEMTIKFCKVHSALNRGYLPDFFLSLPNDIILMSVLIKIQESILFIFIWVYIKIKLNIQWIYTSRLIYKGSLFRNPLLGQQVKMNIEYFKVG